MTYEVTRFGTVEVGITTGSTATYPGLTAAQALAKYRELCQWPGLIVIFDSSGFFVEPSELCEIVYCSEAW